MRVIEQVKRGQEHLSAGLQLVGSGFKLPGDLRPLIPDAVDLVPQLVFGPAFLCRQVEEVAFFAVQFRKLPGELVAHFIAEFKVLINGGLHGFTYLGADICGQDDSVCVVLLNGFFHHVHRHIRVVALLHLPTTAYEVEIFTAIAPSRHDGVAVLTTTAPDHTFQVVGVLPFTGTATSVRVKHPLYAVKQFFGNNRLVPALVFNALVDDFADVEATTQHVP